MDVFSDATALREAIVRGETSAEDTLRAVLARIERCNGSVNALVALDAEAALARARALDTHLSEGGEPGPLAGVPVTVKDMIDVAGFACTSGVRSRVDHRPVRSASVVQQLERAGAVIVGKTNLPELGDAVETDNLVFGRTNNPFDLDRTPGGSSGGEAVAVASGMSALGLGSDSGGSIRIPAHFCGLASIKPTYGRVPRTGLFPPAMGVGHERNQIGPLARSMRDVALALRVIAGPDGIDPTVVPHTLGEPDPSLAAGLRVAVFDDNGVMSPDADTRAIVRNAAEAMAGLGARVTWAMPPGIEETADLMFGHRPESDARTERFRQLTGGAVSRLVSDSAEAARTYARRLNLSEFYDYTERLNRFRARMFAFMQDFDVLLCPVVATPAPLHRALSRAPDVLTISYTQTFNLCGWPTGTVNMGWTSKRLPVGVQINAAPWNDEVVLAVGMALESAGGGFRPPDMDGDR